MYEVAKQIHLDSNTNETCNNKEDRWKRILKSKDQKLIWKSVNWKREIDMSQTNRIYRPH